MARDSWLAALAAACMWTGISWGFLPAQNSFIMLNAGDEAAFAVSLSNSSLQLGSALGSFAAGVFITCMPLLAMPFVSAAFTACAGGRRDSGIAPVPQAAPRTVKRKVLLFSVLPYPFGCLACKARAR